MLDKHPDPRVEAALKLAEVVVQVHSVNGVATDEGGIVRLLTSRIMEDAEHIQKLEAELATKDDKGFEQLCSFRDMEAEIAVLKAERNLYKKQLSEVYYGDEEAGWDE